MRTFAPAEANRTLPLVKRIVADIVAEGHALRELAARPDHALAENEMAGLAPKLREHLAELEALGCTYKDWGFELGLVDFPAIIEGQPVLLCWRSDEERVSWYHTLDGGFAGRTPIPAVLLDGAGTPSSSGS